MIEMGRLFWVNTLFFGVYALFAIFALPFEETFLLHFIESIITLIIVLPLAGINIAAIIEKFTGQKFDLPEKLNIAAITSLLFLPLLLTLEYSQFGVLFKELPLINALVIFLVAIAYNPLSLEISHRQKDPPHESIAASFIISFLLYFSLTLFIVSAYYPLTDSDPYHWLLTIQPELDANTLTPINLHRPLFSSLAYIFHVTADIDFFSFFKYVLPFFMLLALLPTALIARLFPERIRQITIFLLPLGSASFILYSQLPIPQAIINICITFFIFFLLYSWLAKRDFFYFFSGIFIFTAYLYHEISLLVFLPWFITTLFQYRKNIVEKISANKLATILLIVILYSNTSSLYPLYGFIKNWLIRIVPIMISPHTNFSFPLTYTNIDGNVAGWGSWLGVMKYYAFYTGPAIFVTIGILVYSSLSPEFKKSFCEQWIKRKEFLVLSLSFFFFFAIAEILPRFFGVALLPERSWGFAGLFLLALIPLLFRYSKANNTWLALFLIGALLANAGAAIYINSLKKYLITPAQIESAEWIKYALPREKIIFTHDYWSVLRTHAQAEVIEVVDRQFYSNIRAFDTALRPFLSTQEETNEHYREYLEKISEDIDRFKRSNVNSDSAEIFGNLHDLDEQSAKIESFLQKRQGNQKVSAKRPVYIYYTQTSRKNLYANRPYFKDTSAALPPSFVFDDYPDRFKRIYSTPNNEVIIWQLIQE